MQVSSDMPERGQALRGRRGKRAAYGIRSRPGGSEGCSRRRRGPPWCPGGAHHLQLLDTNPAIKARYFADSDPILHYGLPMAYGDFGNVFVVRCQRAVLQYWKVEMPWARAGQVTIANGGDIAKEAGLIPAWATLPEPPPS